MLDAKGSSGQSGMDSSSNPQSDIPQNENSSGWDSSSLKEMDDDIPF